MELPLLFQHLAIALGLGLLVGLQREHHASRLAGLRTFPLIAIFGTVCSLLAAQFGGWVLAAGLIGLTAVILIGNLESFRANAAEGGVTTEVAMLLMFAVGAYIPVGSREVAIAIGAGMAVLLQFKDRLHSWEARLGDDDLRAIMQFVLLSFVILPALPNRTFGPYDVLNPYKIWLMVVLIVGISLGGYVAYKFFGKNAGTVLGGVLGGLISSTATTVSYARRVAKQPDASALATIVVVIASTVVYARLLLELAVVAPRHFTTLAPPMAIMLGVFIALSTAAWLWLRGESQELPSQENPTELKSAFAFGAIYGLVLLAVAAAKVHFGESGLYVVAGISGLTDVDAITLSTAQLVNDGKLPVDDGWRLVLVASTSNLLFKAAAAAALGHRRLISRLGPLYAVAVAAAALILLVWD